jgi:hypothetical protein
MKAICLAVLLATLAAPEGNAEAPSIERAFNRMYSYDFPGVHRILDEHVRAHPEDPLAYSTRALAFLFSELHRLKILETDFFMDDDQVTDRKRLKPDAAVRARLFQMTGEARKRARAILASRPTDRNALFAMCMSAGVETDYTILIEKKYFRSFSLSKESQRYARNLLAMDPPLADAHLTLGMVEYVVSNMNWFFRLFVHFNQIEGSKQKAIGNLKEVVARGQYYGPLAKILLSVVYLREKQPRQALTLMKELERDFPDNPLIRSEVKKISQKIADARSGAN